MNDFDDLLNLAADIAGAYPPGVIPGLHPVEILGGARFGFDRVQARLIANDRTLLDFLAAHWDEHPPTDRYRAQAERDTALGHLHREILRATGHLMRIPPIEEPDWLRPVGFAGSLAAKGAPAPARSGVTTWTVDDPVTDATVLITRDGDDLEISVVPEREVGPARLQLRWSAPTDFTEVEVQLTLGQPTRVRLTAPAPDAVLDALTFSPRPE